MIQAVIFDMDGTLIDTEKYYRICWPQALAHFGYTMSDEQALSMRSLGQPYAPEHLKEMFQDPDLDYPAIRVYRKQLMEEYLERDGIQIKPGAVELLEYLKENGVMNIGDYCRITGLLRNTAAIELRKWREMPETGIDTKGRGTHKVYILKN